MTNAFIDFTAVAYNLHVYLNVIIELSPYGYKFVSLYLYKGVSASVSVSVLVYIYVWAVNTVLRAIYKLMQERCVDTWTAIPV